MTGWQAFAGPLSYNEEITLAVCGDFLSWQTLQWEANESMLTEDKIRQAAGKGSYPKGCDYFARGRVKRVYRRGNGFFEAEVRGSQLYYVEMKIDENGDVSNMLCDCPAFGNYDGACKHLVAVLKKIQQDWRTYFSPTHAIGADLITTAGISSTPSAVSPPGPAEATRRLLSFFRAAPRAISRSGELQTVRLVPTYYFVPHHYNPWGGESWLEFSIGVERLYVVKSIPEFLQALSNNTELVFGKQFALRASNSEFDEKSKALIEILHRAYEEERERMGWTFPATGRSVFETGRRFRLTRTTMNEFFQLFMGQVVATSLHHQPMCMMPVREGRPALRFKIDAEDAGLRLRHAWEDTDFYALDSTLRHICHQNAICQVDPEFSQTLAPLLQCFFESRQKAILFPPPVISDFASNLIPALESVGEVEFGEKAEQRLLWEPLEQIVYLDRHEAGVCARVEFRYGETVINPALTASRETVGVGGKYLVRDTQAEVKLLQVFLAHRFVTGGGQLLLTDEEAVFEFLQEGLPALKELAEVYYSDDFAELRINRRVKLKAGIRLDQDYDWLEMTLDCDGMNPADLFELLASYQLKKHYHRLKDGSFVSLDSPDFALAARLIEEMGLSVADLKKPVIKLPKYRALTIDSLMKENNSLQVERSSAVRRMLQELREPQDADDALPDGIQGVLRDYQKTGFKWLKSLARHGMGGILADDMGLGKTLQVLAFLLSSRDHVCPSLVVAPTSLVYNWQEEAARFTPDLKVLVVAGQPGERQAALNDSEPVDVIITSYGLLKRDIELYEKMKLKYCFLDEAQNVKNPQTLNAQAVKRIRAEACFALTGTPIENSLTELWSIFDFILPGYFRSHASYVKRFEAPIAKQADATALKELGRHIRPFVLRRMKQTVLRELPEKIESKLTAPMTPEQARIYAAWLLTARREFEQEVDEHGFEKSRIKILAILTRLRQLCCHPSLFIENYTGGSGKMELLADVVRDAVAAKHRLLIFSQFTGLLALIKPMLDSLQISWHYLDGATPSQERMHLVNSFNRGDKDVFLISLKAGGAGLNLTGADMVVHCDPWWNPAVEDQATDRAYRIGQKNVVQVFKLVAKGTIEEKILVMQERKRALIDSLIQPGENFIGKMTEAEIRALFGE